MNELTHITNTCHCGLDPQSPGKPRNKGKINWKNVSGIYPKGKTNLKNDLHLSAKGKINWKTVCLFEDRGKTNRKTVCLFEDRGKTNRKIVCLFEDRGKINRKTVCPHGDSYRKLKHTVNQVSPLRGFALLSRRQSLCQAGVKAESLPINSIGQRPMNERKANAKPCKGEIRAMRLRPFRAERRGNCPFRRALPYATDDKAFSLNLTEERLRLSQARQHVGRIIYAISINY
jgi:hypothetical protein